MLRVFLFLSILLMGARPAVAGPGALTVANPHLTVTTDASAEGHAASIFTYSIPLQLTVESTGDYPPMVWSNSELQAHATSRVLRLMVATPVFYVAAALAGGAANLGIPGALLAGSVGAHAVDVLVKELSHRPSVRQSSSYGFRFLKYTLSERLLLTDMLLGYPQRVDGRLGYARKLYLRVDAKGRIREGSADYELESNSDEFSLSVESEADLTRERVPFDRIDVTRPCMKLLREAAYYSTF